MTEDEIITLCAISREVPLDDKYESIAVNLEKQGYVKRVYIWRLTFSGTAELTKASNG